MTNDQFIQQLVIERFKFHLAHLTAVLHTQDTGCETGQEQEQGAEDILSLSLGLESASTLLRAMNEDLNLLERCLEQK